MSRAAAGVRRIVDGRGLFGASTYALAHVYYWFRYLGARRAWHRAEAQRAAAERALDAELGLDTYDGIKLHEMDIPSKSWILGTEYMGVRKDLFNECVGAVPAEPPGFTLLDLGSGKGKALFLAAALGFKRAIGVEFAPPLHETAVENIAKFQERFPGLCDITAVLADAGEWDDYPPEPTILFMANPFYDEIMAKVLDRIRGSLRQSPREFYIAYVNPVCKGLLDSSGFLKLIATGEEFAVYAASRDGS
jgi:hypothetical protein